MSSFKAFFSKYKSNILKLGAGGVKLSKAKCAFGGILDYIIFGSTITDYFELAFYRRSFQEKKKYATWRLHKRFIYEVDDNEAIARLSNKATMYQGLAHYIRRELLFSRTATIDDFKEFCSHHDSFFFKPCGNSCGEGIERIHVQDGNIDRVFQRIKSEDAVLDTPIIQHSAMNALNKGSVNTLRIFTFRNDKNIFFTGCALRMGTNSFIDNYSAGGLVCSVNLKTGKTVDKAENNFGQRFSRHPISNVELEGFQVPKWNEVLQYVFSMAKTYELNYVAWDIAVEEDGVDLVEANPGGMINVIQIAGAKPKRNLILKLEKEWRTKAHDSIGEYQMVLLD